MRDLRPEVISPENVELARLYVELAKRIESRERRSRALDIVLIVLAVAIPFACLGIVYGLIEMWP